MDGEDDKKRESAGFPDDVFQQMQRGHEKFLRQVDEQERCCQQNLERDQKRTSSPSDFFVDFKHFVDTKINNLVESVGSLSTLPTDIRKLMEISKARQAALAQEELAISQRWTGSEDSPDYISMEKERMTSEVKGEAISAALLLLRENRRRTKGIATGRVAQLYNDNDDGTDFCWLGINWFRRSRYSPVSLESPDEMGVPGIPWRAAFEDLLCVASARPMTSGERKGYRWPYQNRQSTYTGPGLDWTLSLICRGILPLQYPVEINDRMTPTRRHLLTDPKVESAIESGTVALARFLKPPPSWLEGEVISLEQLVDEVATPGKMPEEECESRRPKTELDLYGSMYDTHDFVQAATAQPARTPSGTPSVTCNGPRQRMSDVEVASEPHEDVAVQQAWFRRQRQADALDDLWDALEHLDADALVERLYRMRREQSLSFPLLGQLMFDDDATEDSTILGKRLTLQEAVRNINDRGTDPEMAERLSQEMEALGLADSSEQMSAPVEASLHDSRSPYEQFKPVDVLSSLTTTRTTRMPDGTLTTKVVLKQRFADGREETEEELHTYRDPPPSQQQQRDVNGSDRDGEQSKKKGWFWT